jgi:hypothetical protein
MTHMAYREWPPLQQAIRNILAYCQLTIPDEDHFVAEFASAIEGRCGKAIMPGPRESLAFSVMRPKTAALVYDRVYRIPGLEDPVPDAVAFFGASPGEIACAAVSLFVLLAPEAGIELDLSVGPRSTLSPALNEGESLRLIAEEIGRGVGREPTLFYENGRDQAQDFQAGPEEVLTTAITELQLVNEKSIAWEQVLEFRRDREARRKYRRLVRWLDAELAKARTSTEILGSLEDRLEGYEWAIRKHGLSTGIGALSALIDPKHLAAVSATVAAAGITGGPVWAGLAGTALTVGRVLVSIGTTYVQGIDARRGSNHEISFLHELRRKL